MRHIVVEGPDGGGKTNLVNDLIKQTGMPLHPRFVQSTGGPPVDLDIRVMQDFNNPTYQREAHIYDRHPMISEPIYGPIVRGEVRGMFRAPFWRDRYRTVLSQIAVLVWCLPPWSTVIRNVHNPDVAQMDGVVDNDNMYEIYQAYVKLSKRWPGPSVIHDYTAGESARAITINLIHTAAKGD